MGFFAVPDLTLYAVPCFVLAILVEAWSLRGRSELPGGGYSDGRDTLASLALGLGSLATSTGINFAVFTLAGWLAPLAPVDLGGGALGWVVALVAWDFAYYWVHRFEHTWPILWATHAPHHSSEAYNLSTALRQPWFPVLLLVLIPPLALVGIRPELLLLAGNVNLLYQFWVHTEAVDRLPAWFEAVFNTPSHHRVHHASNAPYLDRNHGGILIVWDRLFGTFEPERTPVVYGLTTKVDSRNPLVLAFEPLAQVLRDARARGLVALVRWPTGTTRS